jgi:hypothetical protein
MDRNRILELAVEALKRQIAERDAEIEAIRTELQWVGSRTASEAESAAPTIRRRRPRTPAQRKALSRRMREVWAAKRLRAAKLSPAAKTSRVTLKRKPKTAAQKKALSLKMKQVWAKKKAEAKKNQ